MQENKNENHCYNPDCNKKICDNPEHYNYLCMDPKCDNIHCENHKHYNKQLLKDFQEHTDMTQYDHREKIDYTEDVDIKICNCDDCNDEPHNHKQHHHEEEDECECHEHHHHHHTHDEQDECDCHEHHHHHHTHDEEDSCSCHDEECDCHDEIKICNCDDCADDDENHEVIAEGKPLLSNRSVQIIVSSGILFILGHILEHFSVLGGLASQVVFAVGAIIAGYEIAIMAFNSLFKKHTVSPSLLMCIAAVASFTIGYPEEAAAVTFLYYIAEFLEDYAEQRSQRSVRSLVEITPENARVKREGGEEIVKVDDVKVGEIVIVRPGSKVPLDGIVVSGVSTVDQSSITGESLPITKSLNDKVYGGTLNKDGYMEVKVTKESKDSVISKIVTLVKRSQLNRSHTETYVEKIARYYTPAIILAALCVAIIPPLFLGGDWLQWIYRALSIMVISCPCAFLISTPIGMVSSITSATKQGVLIKGSSHVEQMRNIKAVIFDKTGTLTEGKLEVQDVEVLNDKYTEDELLKIVASLESDSSHPISLAILKYAKISKIDLEEVTDFQNVPGKGVCGVINSKKYYAANESLIDGSDFNVERKDVVKYASNGKTVIFVGDEEKVIGLITVADKIRDESNKVMRTLNDMGVQTVMLTGDNKVAAKAVGEKIGVKYVYSDLMPDDKLNLLDTIRNKFGDVAMVGDGINDAPALARANVGIAMGAVGSDVAIETADIALMQDDLGKLPYLFDLSRKTMTIIKQNIITAISVKFLFVVLAILGVITLMMSVGIGDMGLTLLVILNSFRIGMIKDTLE